MAIHNQLGKQGESLAVDYLLKKGYEILHQNWRYSHYEIDIIARKGKMLHIIEVKARNFSPFGYPEDSVGYKKFKRLQRAADEFLQQNPEYKWLQYDILSITLHPDKEPEYFMLEDVFM
ncbi:MAG TPA: YraN family protein [Chitinophagaceae bacterium]|nr:YraN family protein [Chitinophagaceae bacterium]